MTNTYRTKLRIIMDVECEAASSGEAHRIIDGVVRGAQEIVVYEGTQDDPTDELHGTAVRVERDDIERVM